MLKDEAQQIEEELRDFLAADLLDVRADPEFKERLRRELWELVEQNAVKWRLSQGLPPEESEDD